MLLNVLHALMAITLIQATICVFLDVLIIAYLVSVLLFAPFVFKDILLTLKEFVYLVYQIVGVAQSSKCCLFELWARIFLKYSISMPSMLNLPASYVML